MNIGFQFATLKKSITVWNNVQLIKWCRNKETKEFTQISPISIFLFSLAYFWSYSLSPIFALLPTCIFSISCLLHVLLLLNTSVCFPGIGIFSYTATMRWLTSGIYVDKILQSSPLSTFQVYLFVKYCPIAFFFPWSTESCPGSGIMVRGHMSFTFNLEHWRRICLLWPWPFLKNIVRPPPLTF